MKGPSPLTDTLKLTVLYTYVFFRIAKLGWPHGLGQRLTRENASMHSDKFFSLAYHYQNPKVCCP